MAKTKAKKLTKEELPQGTLSPQDVHAKFGLPGPYEPPPVPISTKGYVTWWDPGTSIQTLIKKHRELFHIPRLYDGERCAKETDSWRWRQWRTEPIGPNLTFEEQQKLLATGDEPAAARELVTYLVLHFLTTGERLDLGRLRCKDLAEGGRRMTVWLSPMGFDLASVSDLWKSPGIGCSVMSTPRVDRKK
jgi:hypothetical protein